MELEFDKYCKIDGSPITVLPSSRHSSKVERRKSRRYPRYGNDLLSTNEDFTDISFHRYRSVSCKNTSARAAPLEYDEVRKRGSVYQSSKEVRLMKKTDVTEGRKKIEFSQSSVSELSFGIVDSLCKSDEECSEMEQKRSSVMSQNSNLSEATISKPHVELHSNVFLDLSSQPVPMRGAPSDGCSDISFEIDRRDSQCTDNAERPSLQDPKFKLKPAIVPLSVGKSLLGRDPVAPLNKSLSAKLALPHSPALSENESSRTSSPRARFGPVRKVFDPFVKSKSQRSPLSSSVELEVENPTGLFSINRTKTLRKSLLQDFSNMERRIACKSWSDEKNYNQLVQSSPAHLHGILKLNRKQGVPLFEFLVKNPEDIFVARTCKADNSLNWIYTFHSVNERRKSDASGQGLKESHKVSSMVAQMQVSCYLCADLKDAGTFDNSMVTEFVLYDTAHPRKSVRSEENSCCFTDVAKASRTSRENSLQGTHNLNEISIKNRIKGQTMYGRNSGNSKSSTSHPLPAAELHPHFQIGAVVVQVPYGNKESLKFQNSDEKIDQPLLSFLDRSGVEHKKELIPGSLSPAKVNVVIPSGNHSLPTTECHGPSPLLDRWRLGGGCDCGGWDMSCPLNILGNPNAQIAENHILMDDQHAWKLFFQGKKDNTPALAMTVMEDGQYAVGFHAQLSTLQAFAVCVALWHTMESSIGVTQEENKQLLQSNSLRVFIDEEVKTLIDAVSKEEKCIDNKRMEEALPSFMVNPTFSPIARI